MSILYFYIHQITIVTLTLPLLLSLAVPYESSANPVNIFGMQVHAQIS